MNTLQLLFALCTGLLLNLFAYRFRNSSNFAIETIVFLIFLADCAIVAKVVVEIYKRLGIS